MMSFGDPGWRSWMLDETTAEPIVRRAAESGVTLFDTGNHYSAGLSEEITGRLLRRIFTRRDEYVVATKVGAVLGPAPHQRGLSRQHILTAVDDSLRRLGTGHIDLYQVHRFDPAIPVAETVAALHDLVHAGKVRYLGAGSMYAWQLAKLQHAAQLAGGPGFISMQNHYNLVYREEEREMIPYCRDAGLGILPWSPLARGLLTGSRTRDGQSRTARASGDPHAAELYTDDDFDTVDTLTAVADDLRLPPATVALAWLLAKPAVTAPILGATHPTHVDHAIAALDVTLSDERVRYLEAPYRPHPTRGHH
ncbi:MAG: aldo/keto reductase [Micromonosporaceae bacterium]|nr:aldo/keto reductase [Micromonosporaceae bacterium]